MSKRPKVVAVHRFFLHLGPGSSGRWPQLTGGRCSEVALVLILARRDLGWSLLTGGRYSEVVVNTSLTVFTLGIGQNYKTSSKRLTIKLI
jgi:hypothetical protein